MNPVSVSIEQAVIPCAGFGTRMLELTSNQAKAAIELWGYPILYFSLYWLWKWGIRRVCLNLHYKPDSIRRVLEGVRWFDLRYSLESPEILGTAGGLKKMTSDGLLEEAPLLWMNPDMLYFPNSDFKPNMNSEERSKLYLKKKSKADNYTGMQLEGGSLSMGGGSFYYIGLSILHTMLVEDLAYHQFSDLADIFRKESSLGTLKGEIFSGECIDLGTKADYDRWKSDSQIHRFGPDWEQFLTEIL